MTNNYEAWAEGWKAAIEYRTELELVPIGSDVEGDYENPYPDPSVSDDALPISKHMHHVNKTLNFTGHMLTPEEVKAILQKQEKDDQG